MSENVIGYVPVWIHDDTGGPPFNPRVIGEVVKTIEEAAINLAAARRADPCTVTHYTIAKVIPLETEER